MMSHYWCRRATSRYPRREGFHKDPQHVYEPACGRLNGSAAFAHHLRQAITAEGLAAVPPPAEKVFTGLQNRAKVGWAGLRAQIWS